MASLSEHHTGVWGPADDRFNSIVRSMAPIVAKCTTPVLAAYNGAVCQFATGTLIRFGDDRFLVTASHAIKQFVEAQGTYPDITLLVEDGRGGVVPLKGRYSATQKARDPTRLVHAEDGDDLDVAVWQLHADTFRKLHGKSFANRTDVSIEADLSSGVYFLVGFPCEWGKFDKEGRQFVSEPLPCIAGADPNAADVPAFDPRLHMAIELDLPNPHPTSLVGISGCSIWKLSDGPLSETWDPSEARIVAVQTGVLPTSRIIKATQWRYVIPVLMQLTPELRPGLNLYVRGM